MRTKFWWLALAPAMWACGSSGGTAGSGTEGEAESESESEAEAEAEGDHTAPPLDCSAGGCTTYVLNHIALPASNAERDRYACDVDGNGTVHDNTVGGALSIVASQFGGSGGMTIQGTVDQSFSQGQVISLWAVKASDLVNAAMAGLQVWLGQDADMDASNNFSGTGMFTVSSMNPTNNAFAGSITGGAAQFGPGPLTLSLALVADSPPLTLPLSAVQISGTIAASGITDGRICGGIRKDVFDQTIIPALAQMVAGRCHPVDMGGMTDDNCTAGATCTSHHCTPDTGMVSSTCIQVRGFFDANQDCVITEDEIRTNSLITSVLSPDLDLYVGDPSAGVRGHDCAPGASGNDVCYDSISLGVGYTTVAGQFTVPAAQ